MAAAGFIGAFHKPRNKAGTDYNKMEDNPNDTTAPQPKASMPSYSISNSALLDPFQKQTFSYWLEESLEKGHIENKAIVQSLAKKDRFDETDVESAAFFALTPEGREILLHYVDEKEINDLICVGISSYAKDLATRIRNQINDKVTADNSGMLKVIRCCFPITGAHYLNQPFLYDALPQQTDSLLRAKEKAILRFAHNDNGPVLTHKTYLAEATLTALDDLVEKKALQGSAKVAHLVSQKPDISSNFKTKGYSAIPCSFFKKLPSVQAAPATAVTVGVSATADKGTAAEAAVVVSAVPTASL